MTCKDPCNFSVPRAPAVKYVLHGCCSADAPRVSRQYPPRKRVAEGRAGMRGCVAARQPDGPAGRCAMACSPLPPLRGSYTGTYRPSLVSSYWRSPWRSVKGLERPVPAALCHRVLRDVPGFLYDTLVRRAKGRPEQAHVHIGVTLRNSCRTLWVSAELRIEDRATYMAILGTIAVASGKSSTVRELACPYSQTACASHSQYTPCSETT